MSASDPQQGNFNAMMQDEMHPRQMGPYTILGQIAQGGMGVIYEGEDLRTGERVAIKTVKVPLVRMIRSIRREIQALARLKHRNIISVLHEGIHDGLPWYAMPLIEGTSLRNYQQSFEDTEALTILEATSDASRLSTKTRGNDPSENPSSTVSSATISKSPLPLSQALSLIGQLCEPLAYLHGEGIIHRDLKPENILISPKGHLVLVDFGLVAKIGGVKGRESLEVLGQVAGTAAYMSPEQIKGEWVDARTDLYSLGCLLYELLCGRPPFVAATSRGTLFQHLIGTPKPPSSLTPGIPPAVDALLLRLLSRDPQHRPGYASDVMQQLHQLSVDWPRDPQHPPRPYLYRSGLVGRAEDLEFLKKHTRALSAGQGGVLLLGGESGIGKTRLVMEVTLQAQQAGAWILSGECPAPSAARLDPSQAAPLRALRRALESVVERCETKGPMETARIMGENLPLLARYEPALERLPGAQRTTPAALLKGKAARQHLIEALTFLFQALAQDTPLLLVLDDLQWADPLLLEWLQQLAESPLLLKTPLLILGTYRTEEISPPLEILLQTDQIIPLRLQRLGREGIGEMVREMLAMKHPPDTLVDFLNTQSEGNPFFVAEYLRAALADGLLTRNSGGHWLIEAQALNTQSYRNLPLPKGLRALIARRLSGVPMVPQMLLEVAAVWGQEGDPDSLQRISKLSETQVLHAMHELQRREILSLTPRGTLRFAHDKLREVTYEQLSTPLRRELHRRSALELQHLQHPDEAEQGEHWQGAGLIAEAQKCFLNAARRAKQRLVPEEALRCFLSFLDLVKHPTQQSIKIRIELAREVLLNTGQPLQARQQFEAALKEAHALNLQRLKGRALLGLADIDRQTGQLDLAEQHYLNALPLHRATNDHAAEGQGLSNLANLARQRGFPKKAHELYKQALVIQRSIQNPRGEGRTLVSLAGLCKQQGLLDEAKQHYSHALSINRKTLDRRGEGIVLGGLAHLLTQRGDLDQARKLYDTAIQLQHTLKNRRSEAIALGNLAHLLTLQEKFTQAEAHLSRAMDLSNKVSDHLGKGILLGYRGDLDEAQGSLDTAQKHHEEALQIHRDIGSPTFQARSLCALARIARRRNDVDTAKTLLKNSFLLYETLQEAQNFVLALCERGHIEQIEGEDTTPTLQQIEGWRTKTAAGPLSEVGRRLHELKTRLKLPY